MRILKWWSGLFVLGVFSACSGEGSDPSPGDADHTVKTGIEGAIYSYTSDSHYNAYVDLGVNNTSVAVRDHSGTLHQIFVQDVGSLVLFSQLTDGSWISSSLPLHNPESTVLSPSLVWSDGALHAGWMESNETDGLTHFEYAEGIPVSGEGEITWIHTHMETFETSDFSTGLKYATMTVPEGGSPLYACTQGYPDLHVRVASLDGELDFSPLHSDLYQEIGKTSDVTLASEGSLVVMVWEEEWIGMGPGISDNLVFRISHDGGVNWSSPKTIHEGGTSPGGDPSVSISNGDVYLVYQRPVKSGGGEIWAARMVAGDTCFRLFGDFGGSVPGWVGPGWLPNIDAQSGAIAISWEHSNLSYFSKDDHRMGVFVVKNAASSLPTVLELEDTSAPTDDSSLYDLVAHVQLGEDLSFVDVFWVRAEWGQGQQVLLTLYHRNDSLY